MSRDHILPVCSVLGLFTFAIFLIVAGHSESFDRVTLRAAVHPELSERVYRIHLAATGRIPTDTAARLISTEHYPGSTVEGLAYRFLFEMYPARAAGMILSKGEFQRGSARIRGWEQAAGIVFGARTGTLTDAELALYCHWVVSGQDDWSPDEILMTRQQLLSRLHRGNAIDHRTRERLSAQPLVLRPTPIPID